MAQPTFVRNVLQSTGSAAAGGFAIEAGGNLADIKTAVDAIQAATEILDDAITVDGAAFTPDTGSVQMGGYLFDDVASAALDEGDGGAARVSANRNQYVQIGDGAGNERRAGVDASNNLQTIGAANSGVDIGDVDILSVIAGTGATNLGKAVDAVAGAADTGVALLAVRDDVLGGVTPAAGDYTGLLVDANGALWTHDDALDAALAGNELQVDIVGALPAGSALIGSFEGADAEGASITSNPLLMSGRVDVIPRSLSSGQTGAVALSVEGYQLVELMASTLAIGKLAANSGVDIGDVDILSVIAGTGATNIGKAEDAAHASGDTGVATWAVRNDILAALAGTDGDYTPFQTDINGALYTTRGDHIRMVSLGGTQATATSTSVVSAPGANKAILILGSSFQQNAATPTNPQRIAIENGTGGAEKAVVRLSANDGAGMVVSHPVLMSTNNAVHLDSDQADSFVWSMTYTIVDM